MNLIDEREFAEIEPAVYLIHPAEAHDWVALGLPQCGVHVMERVGGPSVPLMDWIREHPAP